MKLQLKNVQYSEFASEDSNCFEASLWINGKLACTVSDNGQGGCINWSDWDARQRVENYAATLPKLVCHWTDPKTGKPAELDQCAELLIGGMVEDWLRAREDKRHQAKLRRMCKTQVLFRIPGESYAEGEYHSVRAPFDERSRAAIRQRHGEGCVFLNDELAP